MKHYLIKSPGELDNFFSEILDNGTVAIDSETTGLFFGDKVVGISASIPNKTVYIPVAHKNSYNVPFEYVKRFLEGLATSKIHLIYHNAIYDKMMLYSNFDVFLPHHADTMIYGYLIHGGSKKGLKDMVKLYFNYNQPSFKDTMSHYFGRQTKGKNFGDIEISSLSDPAVIYACEDAYYTLKLYALLKTHIERYRNILLIEENLIDPCIKLNMQGTLIDEKMLKDSIAEYKQLNASLYKEIEAGSYPGIRVNSTKELRDFIYETLGAPVTKRSAKTGSPSTDRETLDSLAAEYPVVGKISKYRQQERLFTAYIEKIPKGLYKGRIYTNFSPTGAVSGRFTSSGVTDASAVKRGINLQNIPVKTETRNIDMRKAFIAPKGYKFVKIDYSQIEYRVLAALAQDDHLIKAFKQGADFHTITASIIYKTSPEEVTKKQRKIGKIFNFGVSYGMTPYGLSALLKTSEAEAEALISQYYRKLPKVVALKESIKEQARLNHFTTTFFGRKRQLNIFEGSNASANDRVLNQAFSTVIQGTAADILKLALLRLKATVLDVYKEKVEFNLTVHDEFDFCVSEDVLEEVIHKIIRAMEIPVPDNWPPIIVDTSVGDNWSEESSFRFEKLQAYSKEPFKGWKEILPKGLTTSLDG